MGLTRPRRAVDVLPIRTAQLAVTELDPAARAVRVNAGVVQLGVELAAGCAGLHSERDVRRANTLPGVVHAKVFCRHLRLTVIARRCARRILEVTARVVL